MTDHELLVLASGIGISVGSPWIRIAITLLTTGAGIAMGFGILNGAGR